MLLKHNYTENNLRNYKNMKKFWALAGIVFLLGGCESFGKGVAQAFLEKKPKTIGNVKLSATLLSELTAI